MTNHITKTWFDGKTVVTITKEIPVEEFYKREWVNLTVDELIDLEHKHLSHENLVRAIEAKLREKNT